MSTRTWWWGLLILGVCLRLFGLPTAPLNLQELHAVWAALEVARGQGAVVTEAPLLTLVNAGAFVILGAGEGTARWLSALAGCALLLLPWLWRRRIGEVPALVSMGLLVLSPLALGAARRATPEGLGLLGAALLWTAALAGVEGRLQRVLVAAGWLIGLGGGPVFYDALLGGILAWGLTAWAYPEAEEVLRPRFEAFWWQAALAGAAALAAAGWVAGLGADAPLVGLAAWIASWRAVRVGYGLLWPLLYEPLTVGLALLAFGRALRVPSPWAVFTWLWAFGALLLVTLRPGAAPLAVVSCLPPLTLLAGLAAEPVRQSWRTWQAGGEGLHAGIAFLLWVHASLALARQTTWAATGWEWAIALLVVLMQGLVVAGFRLIFLEPQRAWRGLLAGTAGLLLLLQAGTATAVAFWRAANPNEPLTGALVSPDLAHARQTLAMRATHLEDVELALVGAGDTEALLAARWALRDVATSQVARWADVTTAYALTGAEGAALEGWIGRPYVAVLRPAERVPGCTQAWPPLCRFPLAWYFYRTNPMPYGKELVALWFKP